MAQEIDDELRGAFGGPNPRDSGRSGDRARGSTWRQTPTAATRPDIDSAEVSGPDVSGDLNEQIFGLIYRQMYSLTGGRRQDLDDLVQDAVEQALRSLPSFRGDSKLSTWTYQIAYRTVLKNRRWYGRWLRRFALSLTGELPDPPSPHDFGANSLEEQEKIDRLRAAVRALSPKRRAVVILHDLEGMDIGEIALIVRAKETTVRSRLRDGRRQLAGALRDDPYFGAEACDPPSELQPIAGLSYGEEMEG